MTALVWEIVLMGTFVFGVSYGLHFLAFQKGLGDENNEVKRQKRDGKKTKEGNLLLRKWLDFGGGYYGIVAFVKLLFIEFAQFKDFVADWPGLSTFIKGLDIGWLIGFFIEQFKNFVQAIMWPTDYLGTYSIAECVVFLGCTYGVYLWSQSLACVHVKAVSAS